MCSTSSLSVPNMAESLLRQMLHETLKEIITKQIEKINNKQSENNRFAEKKAENVYELTGALFKIL